MVHDTSDLTQRDTDASPLDIVGSLVGGEWIGEGRWEDGTPFYARNRYTWGVGRKLIHGRTFARSKGKEE
jgi:hypothetical protein